MDDLQSNLSYTLKPLRKIDLEQAMALALFPKRSATQSWKSSVVWLEVFSNTFDGILLVRTASDFNLLYVLRSHDSELVLNDMLFNADKSHFSSMKIKYTFHSCQQDKKGGYYLSYLHFWFCFGGKILHPSALPSTSKRYLFARSLLLLSVRFLQLPTQMGV